jgi:hypothetical protein
MNTLTPNKRRAERAKVAIQAYENQAELTEDGSEVADLLADLMHWFDANHADDGQSGRLAFNESLLRATENYHNEIEES